FDQGDAGERAAARRRRDRDDRADRGAGQMERQGRRARDLVHAGARAAAGFYGRAGGGGSGGDAHAIKKLGGDPAKISPLQPVDLVIDHSVQVDSFGSADSFAANARLEFERNRERYLFLRWGQGAFDNFRVVPPDTGIVHQVNLEYLAPVVFSSKNGEAYPDTVIGTDSHTTMVNGLGVVGWGVGGIEAEAAMLGRSVPMLIPEVIGFRLAG